MLTYTYDGNNLRTSLLYSFLLVVRVAAFMAGERLSKVNMGLFLFLGLRFHLP